MTDSLVKIDALGKKSIVAQPLTSEAFSPFGDVIEVNDQGDHFKINQGFTTRYHNLTDVEFMGDDARAIINIFRSSPLALPINIGMMERHPLGSQAFIPMSKNPYLVVVAPKGELDVSQIKVFLAQSNQGVNYYTGTWHHFCLALNEQSDFLVVDRGGEGHNCDEIAIEGDDQITIKF